MVEIFSLDQASQWKKYIKVVPQDQHDIYFTPEYYSLYVNYGDGNAFCFIYRNGNDIAIYPFLKNSINVLGYNLDDEYFDIQGAYGYNGIISNCNTKEFRNNFFKAFYNYCMNENIVAEFTRFNPYLGNQNFSKSFHMLIFNRRTIILDISKSYEKIWTESYSSKNRNMIRKASKGGYRIKINNTKQGIRKFYQIYSHTMKLINADPYYYFNINMFKEMSKISNFNFLFVEDLDNNTLATMILIIYGDYAHYHLSGRSLNYKDNSVNNFMLDEAIKIAKEKGASKFHLGGGNTSEENDTLLKFKSNFSKENSDFYIGKKIHNKRVYAFIVKQWKENHPKSYKQNKNLVLGYREY